jgi:hypothetical protein
LPRASGNASQRARLESRAIDVRPTAVKSCQMTEKYLGSKTYFKEACKLLVNRKNLAKVFLILTGMRRRTFSLY